MNISRFAGKTNPFTASKMYEAVEKYHGDLGALSKLNIFDFFNYVKNIPFRTDAQAGMKNGNENVGRPAYYLNRTLFPALDCKKKSTLIASWARSQVPPIPYRFIGMSEQENRKIHHVFPQLFIGGRWMNFDATFSNGAPGMGQRKATFAMEFFP